MFLSSFIHQNHWYLFVCLVSFVVFAFFFCFCTIFSLKKSFLFDCLLEFRFSHRNHRCGWWHTKFFPNFSYNIYLHTWNCSVNNVYYIHIRLTKNQYLIFDAIRQEKIEFLFSCSNRKIAPFTIAYEHPKSQQN